MPTSWLWDMDGHGGKLVHRAYSKSANRGTFPLEWHEEQKRKNLISLEADIIRLLRSSTWTRGLFHDNFFVVSIFVQNNESLPKAQEKVKETRLPQSGFTEAIPGIPETCRHKA